MRHGQRFSIGTKESVDTISATEAPATTWVVTTPEGETPTAVLHARPIIDSSGMLGPEKMFALVELSKLLEDKNGDADGSNGGAAAGGGSDS